MYAGSQGSGSTNGNPSGTQIALNAMPSRSAVVVAYPCHDRAPETPSLPARIWRRRRSEGRAGVVGLRSHVAP